MTTNSNKLKKIQKLNDKIEVLENSLSNLNYAQNNFTKLFPKHSFAGDEKNLVELEVKLLEEEIAKISNTIEKGTPLDVADVTKTVLDAWGRTKIEITVMTPEDNIDEFESAVELFKQGCALTFEHSELQVIQYYLDTHSRNDLFLVRVFLAPGFSYASLDTGKVGWGVDVVSNDKFLNELAKQINQ